MMKNYEEALETFGGEPDNYGNYKTVTLPREKVQQDYKLLQETLKEYKLLKERATPKKVTVIDEPDLFYIYYCPNCGATLMVNRNGHPKHLFNYCGSCGQALKWSE